MVNFLSKILIITAGLLFVNLTLALTIKSSKELYWETSKLSGKEIIGLGDSHPMDALNQNQSSKIGEFCWMGDSYQNIYTRIKYLDEAGLLKNVNTVLLAADPYMFTEYRNKPLDEVTSNTPSFVDIWFPLFNNKYVSKDLLRAFKKRDNLKLHDAIQYCDPANNLSASETKSRFENQYNKSLTINSGLVNSFKNALTIIKKHPITVFAIKFPLSERYQALAGESEVYKNRAFFCDSLFKANGIHVIDLRNGFKESDFKNSDHLNCEVSLKFINILSDTLSNYKNQPASQNNL